MLGKVTKDDFRPLIGEPFIATDQEGKEYTFTLTEVAESRFTKGPAARREPFSLIFKGPKGIPVGQGTIPLYHPSLATEPLPIFLVPVGQDAENDQRLVYQAIFS